MKYLRLVALCVIAWWPMMAVHELGHIIGSLFSGAKIEKVILWPWTISQTIRSGSNAPAVDTWFGPLFGALAPLLVYLPFRRKQSLASRLLGFFCGFCLIANGVYLGLGWVDEVGDAGDLIRLGTNPVWLFSIGTLFVISGLYVWHLESLEKEK
jgi:hypothetical protein